MLYLVVLLLYVFFLISTKLKFNRLLRKNMKDNNYQHVKLFGHGAQTLINGIDNLIALAVLIFLGFIILYLNNFIVQNSIKIGYDLYSIFKLILLISTLLGLLNCLYNISEVKYLVDGISTNSESDEFYSWYFRIGINNFIVYLGLVIYANFSIITYIIIIILVILLFILGMGDVLQTKGINYYSEKAYSIKQTFRLFIDIPVQLFWACFTKEGSYYFITKLKNNLNDIKNGFKRYMLIKNSGK